MAEDNTTSMLTPHEIKQLSSLDSDFSVERKEAGRWKIRLLSARGGHWFEASFARGAQTSDEYVLETNLAGANAFIHKARVAGFRTEYIGPIAKSYF